MSFQNTDQTPERTCLGKIVAAHGVKGLVKILPFGDDPALLNGVLYIAKNGTDTVSITLKNPLGRYILASIDGVLDRNAAEDIRGTELFLNKDILPEIEDEDSFYIDDLVGLEIFEDGSKIGKVTSVENFGAGDLLDIQLISGQSFYLPFKNEYVLNVSEVITVQNHKDMIIE